MAHLPSDPQPVRPGAVGIRGIDSVGHREQLPLRLVKEGHALVVGGPVAAGAVLELEAERAVERDPVGNVKPVHCRSIGDVPHVLRVAVRRESERGVVGKHVVPAPAEILLGPRAGRLEAAGIVEVEPRVAFQVAPLEAPLHGVFPGRHPHDAAEVGSGSPELRHDVVPVIVRPVLAVEHGAEDPAPGWIGVRAGRDFPRHRPGRAGGRVDELDPGSLPEGHGEPTVQRTVFPFADTACHRPGAAKEDLLPPDTSMIHVVRSPVLHRRVARRKEQTQGRVDMQRRAALPTRYGPRRHLGVPGSLQKEMLQGLGTAPRQPDAYAGDQARPLDFVDDLPVEPGERRRAPGCCRERDALRRWAPPPGDVGSRGVDGRAAISPPRQHVREDRVEMRAFLRLAGGDHRAPPLEREWYVAPRRSVPPGEIRHQVGRKPRASAGVQLLERDAEGRLAGAGSRVEIHLEPSSEPDGANKPDDPRPLVLEEHPSPGDAMEEGIPRAEPVVVEPRDVVAVRDEQPLAVRRQRQQGELGRDAVLALQPSSQSVDQCLLQWLSLPVSRPAEGYPPTS